MDQSDPKRGQKNTVTDWEEALSRLQNVIACEDKDLQVRTIIKLAHYANLVPEDILARSIQILLELLRSPINSSSIPIKRAAVYCLQRIACHREGEFAVIIGQSGAIPSLLRLLRDSEGSFQRDILKCLRNIVTFGDLNRTIVVRNGGLEIILGLFITCSDYSKRLLLEIFSALALLREVRRVIISLGGLCFLVEAGRRGGGSVISRTRAAQAIGLLGLARRARRMLVDLDVIPVLIELMKDGDTSAKLVAGNALGVILSRVDYIVAQAEAIPLYAELLEGPEPMGKEIAEDAFCVLAVAEANAVAIMDQLVRIFREGSDEAKAAAADVLWNLSAYKHSVSVIKNSGAIQILVELLTNENGDIRERVSGAIAQLSYNEEDRWALSDAGVIRVLMEMLGDESEDLRDNAAEALVNFAEDPRLSDRASGAFDVPAFQNMQDRLIRIRNSPIRVENPGLV